MNTVNHFFYNKYESFVLFGIFIVVFAELTNINYYINTACTIVGVLFFLFKIYFVDKSENKIAISLLITFTFILSRFSINGSIYILVMMFFATKNIEYKKIFGASFLSHLSSLFYGLFLFVIGLRQDKTRLKLGIMTQHTLGFSHYNMLGYLIMMAVFGIVVCFKNKLKIKHHLFLLLIVFGLFFIHGSVSSTICTIIFIIGNLSLTYLKAYFNEHYEMTRKIIYTFIVVFILIMTIIPFFQLDIGADLGLLNNFYARFITANIAIKECGIGFIGKKSWYYLPLDNLYIYGLFYTGILITFVFYILNSYSFIKIIENKKWTLVLIFVLLVVYSSMEVCMFGTRNPFVCLGLAEYSKKSSATS